MQWKRRQQRQQAQAQQHAGRLRERQVLRVERNLVDVPGGQQEERRGQQRRD